MTNLEEPLHKNSANNKHSTVAAQVVSCISSAIVGLSIGTLVGLSLSPVVGSVIGGILAMATAVLAIVVGWKRREVPSLNMIPLACFTAFLVIGAILGISTRTHNLLAPNLPTERDERQKEVDSWVALGIDKDEAVRAVFAEKYPLTADVRALRITDPIATIQKIISIPVTSTLLANTYLQFLYPPGTSGSNQGNKTDLPTDNDALVDLVKSTLPVLWASETTACADLSNEVNRADTLQQALERSALSRWQALAVIEDTSALQAIISEDLCPAGTYRWPWE